MAGFAVWTALWLVGNAALRVIFSDHFQADGSTTNIQLLVVILGWSVVCSVVAGYITAITAGDKAMKYALALGADPISTRPDSQQFFVQDSMRTTLEIYAEG